MITRSAAVPLVSNFCVAEQPISDHKAITFNLTLNKPPNIRKIVVSRTLKNLDVETFIDAVNQRGLPDDNLCLASVVSTYEQVLEDTLNQMAPIRSRLITIRNNAPWYSDEIAIEKRLRRKLERKWRRSRLECDRLEYIQQCGIVNQLLRSNKEAYYSKFIEENSTDSRKLFKSMNKLLYRNLDPCYPTAKSDTDLACAFADFFMQKIERIRYEIAVGRSVPELTTMSETEQCFSCETKLQSFKSLTNNEVFKLIKSGAIKSCSLDPLPASIMAKCCHALLPMLTRIINLSLGTGEMPEDLKCAMLRPLLKKPTADYKVFANFRPVSNLKYISKLIEKAVAVQLNDHLACNDLHVPFQSAYRSCHSTESALMRVHNDIMISLDSGNSVLLVLLDLSAAFDTVNHDLLLSRLEKRFGITGTALNWFRSYLCSRTQFVSINQSHSTKRDLLVGVPQGSVLGPLLYLLYTAPISDVIASCQLNYHLYADDTQLYLAFKTDDAHLAADRIVSCVSAISCWMEQNDLKLNPEKTDILLIHSRFREGPVLDYLQFRDERISISDKVMILGVILDKHMTFDDQIDHVCKSSINHLRNLFRIRRYLDVNAASTVIHAFITTRLDYCNHLYIGLPKYKVEKLQKIQNIAARYVTGARKYDHITPILVQLHWLPVSYRIVFKHLLFVYKSLNGLCPQYLTNLLEHRKSARSLRSNSQDLLVQPSCKTKTYGDRAFSVCAPKIWNSVPLEIRHSSTVLLFKKKLKTFLFTKFIESNSLSYF